MPLSTPSKPLLLAIVGALLAGCAAPSSAPPAAFGSPLKAQQSQFAADFDSFMKDALEREPSIPAVAVAVTRSDETLYAGAFGMADIEHGVPATTGTRFYIASSTKSYVGLAFALLDMRGAIDLDWSIAELAPDIAFDPALQTDKVTLRHLLSHSHGLIGPGMQYRLAYSGQHDPALLLSLLPTLRPNPNAPLGKFAYSNIGYNVAALLVERRIGRSWQRLVEEEVLAPLRARQTHTRGLAELRSANLVAVPYLGIGPNGPERLSLLKVDSNMQSAGGLFASVNDLAQWLQLQLAAEQRLPGASLLDDAVTSSHRPWVSLDDNFGPFRQTGYGLGWFSGPYGEETLYHSFGGFPGARSHVSFMPAQDLGIVAVTNDEGAGSMLVDIAALYAYTWFSESSGAAQLQGAQLIDRMVAQAEKRRRSIADDRARQASRIWQLEAPHSAYGGSYCNAEWGTLEVSPEQNQFRFTMGAMSAQASPFTDAETMRVELIPNEAMKIVFSIVSNEVTGLSANGTRFERCG